LKDEIIFEEISILRALFYLDMNNPIPFKKKPNIIIDGDVNELRAAAYFHVGAGGGCSITTEDILKITPKSRFKTKNLDDKNIRYILILFSEINRDNLLIRCRKINEVLEKTFGKNFYKQMNITNKEWKKIRITINFSKSYSSAHNTTEKQHETFKDNIISDESILYYFRRFILNYVIEDRGFSEIEFLD